jgi:hypothetical protein
MNTVSERETDPGESEEPHENQILGRNSTALALLTPGRIHSSFVSHLSSQTNKRISNYNFNFKNI